MLPVAGMNLRALDLVQARESCARGELALTTHDLDALSLALATGESRDATLWMDDALPPPRSAVIAQRQAGRWGSVLFGSAIVPGENAVERLSATVDWLFSFEGLETICALSPRKRYLESEALRGAGFVHVTEIVRRQRSVSTTNPLLIAKADGLSVRAAVSWEEAESIVRRTQVGSQDCLELGEHSPLERFRERRDEIPSRVRVYECAGAIAGVGMGHADDETWSLDYLGVVPESRGRGWGKIIVAIELTGAFASGRRSARVDVDVRNHYAIAIYDALGFREAGRRDLWVARRSR